VFVCRALTAHLEAAGLTAGLSAAGTLPSALSAQQRAVCAQVSVARFPAQGFVRV
jgi:hypothetical protein